MSKMQDAKRMQKMVIRGDKPWNEERTVVKRLDEVGRRL